MCQLCAIDLAYFKVGGDIPILALAWGAPKVGNKTLATWVTEQPNLRILRISVAVDTVIHCKENCESSFHRYHLHTMQGAIFPR